MANTDGLVNTDSFINALNYLQNAYYLDHQAAFIRQKLNKASTLTLDDSVRLLRDLDFQVESTSVAALDGLALGPQHLVFYFDHEHDIIILRHDSDFSRVRTKHTLAQPILVLNSAQIRQKHDQLNERKDFAWFLKRLFAKEGMAIILTGIITNLLMYVVPIYNMNVFDKVLPNGFLGILSSLVVMAVFLTLIWFINRSALSYLLSDKIFHLEVDLNDAFTRRLCQLKPSVLPQSSAFLTQLVTYGRSLSQMLGLLQLLAAVDLPFLLLALTLIGFFGGYLIIIPLAATVLIIGINWLLQPRIRQYINDRYAFDGRKRKFEYEMMQSLPFIKLGNMERYFTDYFQHYRPDHRRYYSISAHINHLSTLILFLSLIAVTGFGAYLVSINQLTIGQLVACSLLTAKAISNAKITNLLFNFYRMQTLFDHLNTFYDLPVEEKRTAFCLSRIKHLALTDICYHYPQNPYFNLNKINIHLKTPDRLFIYGPPGAGKTTIFNMLAGLAAPSDGHILVNRLNVEHFDYRDIRSHIHFSSSYYRFFTGTLYDNLALGRSAITADQITAALEKVLLTEKINQIDGGLHFKVENVDNVPLSSSERKRFMLARIFLTDADLVVLDEPFDYLSDENSYYLLQHIVLFCQEHQKGLIILSNRKGFASFFENRVMLNNGRLYPMQIESQRPAAQ